LKIILQKQTSFLSGGCYVTIPN